MLEYAHAPLVDRRTVMLARACRPLAAIVVLACAVVACGDDAASASDADTGGSTSAPEDTTGSVDDTSPGTASPDGTTSGGPPPDDTTTGQGSSDTAETGGVMADPCLVPAGQFLGLTADGLELGTFSVDASRAMVQTQWSFASEQLTIEVDGEGRLFALGQGDDSWVVTQHCYESGEELDALPVGLSTEAPIASMTIDPDGVFLVVAPSTDPKSGEAIALFTVDADTGALTPYPLGSIYCEVDDVEYPFPLVEYNPRVDAWPAEREYAIANELDQMLGASTVGTCTNYTGGYPSDDDALEYWVSMDYDAADYDEDFEQATGLWGLSYTNRIYSRSSVSTGNAELVTEPSVPLRAIAIGPAAR